MEKNYMSSDSLIELEFIADTNMATHYHENIELLYLLNGNLVVTVEEETFALNPRDMLVINANRKHSYEGDQDAFLGRFVISCGKTKELLKQNMIMFWCNSVVDKNQAYDELRTIITQIFNQYHKNEAMGRIYLNSLYYQMLHTLTSNFLLTVNDIRYEAEKSKADDRIQEIFEYIRTNYRQNISLQDLAEQLYLSSAYLSKYIKKKCDASFIELINSVRLDHAMEDLLYTNESIMKIAMDNGFASVAAYNKTFKEKYAMTPSEFRRQIREKQDIEEEKADVKRTEMIQERVEAYLEENPVPEKEKKNSTLAIAEIDLHHVVKKDCIYQGNRMMNAGTASDLTKSAFQQQILQIKEKLGIKYVRFWDIYAPELYLDIHASRNCIHFGRLDEVTDFLVNNGIKPYIELAFKPIRLLKTTQNALMEVTREQEFTSDQEMEGFFEEFILHFMKRYGVEEVRSWYFEYWKKEDVVFLNLSYTFRPLSEDAHQDYFDKFDILAGAFRRHLPEVKVGGGGFSMQHYGREGFQEILRSWKAHKELPNFISLNSFPYQIQRDGNTYFEKKSTDMFFVKHNIELAKELLRKMDFPKTEFHVSEYSLTLSNRNVINDNCLKAAYLMQNAISCLGEADILGYWLASDRYADFHDAQCFLFGGCGLLTKTGVAKPAFYAFEFLQHLHNQLYAKDKNYIITGNERGSLRIVCHNFKNLNYNYYLVDEDKIKIQDIPLMLENQDYLTIKVKIKYVKNGIYTIKTSQVNKHYGSIQDEWLRLNMETELNMREQNYLERICTPRLSIQKVTVDHNLLEFDIVLEPNEIQYLHITYHN